MRENLHAIKSSKTVIVSLSCWFIYVSWNISKYEIAYGRSLLEQRRRWDVERNSELASPSYERDVAFYKLNVCIEKGKTQSSVKQRLTLGLRKADN